VVFTSQHIDKFVWGLLPIISHLNPIEVDGGYCFPWVPCRELWLPVTIAKSLKILQVIDVHNYNPCTVLLCTICLT